MSNLGAFPAVAVAPQTVAFPGGGRLTLVPNTPVMASDQVGKSVIYYTPDRYGAFPVIKGGVIRPVYFASDLQLTMTSAFTGSGIFDLFGIERSGKAVLIAGTAWATATAGAGARGTTPGQTELTRVAGATVNRWGMPGLSSENSTYTNRWKAFIWALYSSTPRPGRPPAIPPTASPANGAFGITTTAGAS